MEREVLVFMDLPDATVPVGKLWTRSRGARETASFEYDPSWLSHRHAFGLAPGLPLARGPFHTDRPLFNAFTDSAPDRWGQTLLRRNERRRARAEGRQPRTLRAVDFVGLVDDEARLGALRFQDPRTGCFLISTGRSVPPLVVDIPRLFGAASRIMDDEETDEDLCQLWRRIVFNMLISNTDDHLRNHGFLRGRKGWRLAPAYDLNPVPTDVKPRVHALAIDEFDPTASLDTAFRIAPMFGMSERAAREIAAEVGRAVARWRDQSTRLGIAPNEMERMSSAFEHEDLRAVT